MSNVPSKWNRVNSTEVGIIWKDCELLSLLQVYKYSVNQGSDNWNRKATSLSTIFFSRRKLSCIRCTLPENRSNRNCPGFEPRSRNPGRLRWSSLSWTRSPGSSTLEEKARVLIAIVFSETRFGRILPFGPIFQIWRIKFEAYLLFGNFFGSLLQKILLWANYLFSNLSNFYNPFGHIWPQRALFKLYLTDTLLSE